MAASIQTIVFQTQSAVSHGKNPVATSVLKATRKRNLGFSVDLKLKEIGKLSKFSEGRGRFTVFATAGSPGIASSGVSEDAISSLDTVEVFDLNGKSIPISDLWEDRKAVVAFARHFGCVFCRRRADFLASKKDRMDASGVALVIIGPGSVDQAKAFSEQTKFKGEVYADPSHLSYRALSFVSGVSTTFTPGAGLKIIQLYMEGYRQDWGLSFEKDTVTRGGWQQGGIIVAGPGRNNISYVHKDKEAGDDPDIEDVLKACCS
ncbi:PREDICTED: thioredoxin-like protein AAED1, chloroplastic [Nelumbo nucifera]|uniref:Thioredoxin-like protein AAED1, chloroplastic n=2 Tax=Nelumbo nucifera TaxID=4432 RepID=A0A822Y243_NELNU|nr:PREDICTED: thioredoxin-like protein AAED1, chloroplastic [Nelumbo nucifera]DAD26033.1 TPA_asm: hypothetical protein HUJ06_027501 [Nelumbo nucifera]